MPDLEQPASTESAAVDAAAPESASDDASTSDRPSPWHQWFGFLSGRKAEDKGSAAGATEEQPQAQHSSTLTLSQEELDRRVQAETDRREAKRQREAVEKAARDRQEAIERKLDPNAPDYDPYAGAEERDKLKQEAAAAEQFSGFLSDIGKQHDSATLDVLVAALPKAEAERIFKIEGAGVGLEGRKLIVAEGLKALEKHWKAEGRKEAEANLSEDPIFRKRVFAEHRGDTEEPELIPANGATPRGDPFMEQVFSDYHALKGRRR